jgi:phosphoglycolate phosphatase
MGAFIFDFDGTLADSFAVVAEVFHELTGHRHKMSEHQIEAFRGKPAHQVVRELGIRWWRLPMLVHRGRRAMRIRMEEIQIFPGMPGLIKHLHAEGHKLFILSSNSAGNIRRFLAANGLEEYFTDVQGGIGLFGKISALRRILRKHHIRPGNATYVGDEVRDILAAKRAGTHMVAVAWGYNNPDILADASPDMLVKTPAELKQALDKNIR